MIKEAIQTIVSGHSLTMDEASNVMEEIMEGMRRRPIRSFYHGVKVQGRNGGGNCRIGTNNAGKGTASKN